MTIAYIGLGSNLENPIAQLSTARRSVAALSHSRELACSSFYRSAPMGPSDQPDYVNAVMAIETDLSVQVLLARLQDIEQEQGRIRTGLRWGPRTLDLDILLYGDDVIATDTLTVPHPGLSEREFVLYPLAEIAPPELAIPTLGKLSALVGACPRRGLSLIEHG